MPVDAQVLSLEGRLLAPGARLNAAGVTDGSTVRVSSRLRGGAQPITLIVRPRVQRERWSLYWKETMATKTELLKDMEIRVDPASATGSDILKAVGKALGWQNVEELLSLEGASTGRADGRSGGRQRRRASAGAEGGRRAEDRTRTGVGWRIAKRGGLGLGRGGGGGRRVRSPRFACCAALGAAAPRRPHAAAPSPLPPFALPSLLARAGFEGPWERLIVAGRELELAKPLAEQGVTQGATLVAVRLALSAEGWKLQGDAADDSSEDEEEGWTQTHPSQISVA